MSNQLIDAVKTAIAIHNGDYSSLRGKFFVIRGKIRKKNHHSGDKAVNKSRLDQIQESINNLTNLTMQMNDRFDNLEKDVKDINARIDRIDDRLDYIVKANNLKDSK